MSSDYQDSAAYLVSNEADVSRMVVQVASLPMLCDATQIDRSLIITIVSELSSNIVKYAHRGAIRLCRREGYGSVDIDIFATDEGPGIADINRAMADHFSTGGSLGLGLPGVQRMADHLWMHSSASSGTQICARKRIVGKRLRSEIAQPPAAFATGMAPPPAAKLGESAPLPWQTGIGLRPCPGFVVSGDRALCLPCEGGVLFGIVDVSGHGPRADVLAERLDTLFMTTGNADIARLMSGFSGTLTGTLGAAAGLVYVDSTDGSFAYLGVGNTRVAQLGSTKWRGVSRDGVLGTRNIRFLPQTGRLRPDDLLLLWTDGIPEEGCVALAQSMFFCPAGYIADAIVDSLAKSYDDAACLVVRWLG